jgi:dephospho-CoA kinase
MKKKVLSCTGGIGSGKSYVIKVFNALDIPSYDCDQRAKDLYNEDKELLADVVRLVGEDVLLNGVLQRNRMAQKIFSDKELIYKVEDLVHPAVLKDFFRWKDKQNKEIVIFESAIFLEKPIMASLADKTLTISIPVDVRIERVMKRDGLTREQVVDRINNQWSDRQREEKADYVIYTNDRDAILPKVMQIIKEMKDGI